MSDPTPASVLAAMSTLVNSWQTYIDQQRALYNGDALAVITTPAGQPAPGYYPLTEPSGITVWVACPARDAYESNLLSIVDLTGSNSLALAAAHNGKYVRVYNANSPITLTIPNLGAGFHCIVLQKGAGQILFSQGSGVTLTNAQSFTHARAKGSEVSVIFDQSGSCTLAGDMVL